MHWAALCGRKDVAEFLLANMADANARDNFGRTPLQMAATGGPQEVHITGVRARRPLHWAQGKDQKSVAELLLANKADINAKDNNGSTPLHWAVGMDRKDMAEFLLANKADVDARNNGGVTPLHWAASSGHKDLVELLLTNKADVNSKDQQGKTPLGVAVVRHHNDVAEVLRQHGGHE